MIYKYILNGEGNPVPEPDLLRWAEWFESSGARRVAFTQVSDEVKVSTVFLGLDHNFGMQGPPVLWETMIFGGKHDTEMWRYSSKEDALVGHDFAVHVARGDI